MMPKETAKEKQMDPCQTQKLLHSKKKAINKMKRQIAEWEKIFANYIPDKGLLFKIYIELSQFN